MQDIPGNLVMWNGIIGFIMPVVLSVIIQSRWPEWAKSVVAFAACLIAGYGTAYFAGNLTNVDIITGALVVFTVAISTYYGLWKPSGVAPAIRRATDVGHGA